MSTMMPTISAGTAEAQGNGCVQACTGGTAQTGSTNAVTAVVWETVTGGSAASPVGRTPAWLQLCEWNRFEPGEVVPNDLVDGEFQDGFDVATWVVTCPRDVLLSLDIGDAASGILDIFPDGVVPQPLLEALIREAYEQSPVVAFYPNSAPAGDDAAPLVTRFPIWLWVDETDWAPVSASASIPPVTVTATATPVEATWSGGDDPETVSCGAGTAFDPAAPFESQSTACLMRWNHSSAVGLRDLTLEVRWNVEFVCSAICGAGTLPDIVTSSTRPVQVAEIQALVTRWGG